MPLLQIALDLWEENEACELARRLAPYADILEIGTPLLLSFGLPIVSKIREIVGEKPLFVDAKIVDAGEKEAEAVFQSGGDIVSVLGGASLPTLEGVKKAVEKWGKRWVVDTIDLPPDSWEKIVSLVELQPDFVGFHLPHDVACRVEKAWQKTHFLSHFVESLPLLVAGGITPEILPEVLKLFRPRVVVVGSAITASPFPERATETVRRILDEFSRESSWGS